MEVHLQDKVFPALSLITKVDNCQQEQLQQKNASVCCEVWVMLWFELLQAICLLPGYRVRIAAKRAIPHLGFCV